jgi:uncharacterized protein (DUF2147 family)
LQPSCCDQDADISPESQQKQALRKSDLLLLRPAFAGDSMAFRSGFLALLLMALATAPVECAAQAGGNPSGIWLTQDGDAKIKISKCGGGICGVIVWLREPIDPATGKPAIDDKNPDPALARRPMMGLPLFSGMRPSSEGRWSGKIYNADDGKSYDSHIRLIGPDQLRVEGCVGPLCGGETWARTTR